MINHYKNVRVSSIVFFFNFIITIVVGIFFVPIYLNQIGIKIYGAWLVLTSVLQIFSSFDPGFATVFEQRFSILFSKKEYDILSTTLLLALIMIGLLVTSVFFIGWLAYPYIIKFSNITEYTEQLRSSFFIALLGTALLIGSYGLNGIVNGFQKIIYIAILQLVTNLLGLIALLVLIYNNFGVLALAISILIRGLFSFIVPLFYLLNQYLKLYIKPSNYLVQLKLLLRLFTYTSASRFLGVLVMNLDSTIISKFYTTTDVNIIAFTKKIPTFLFNAFDIPVNSILPTLSYLSTNTHNNERLKNIVINLISVYTRTILVLAVYFILFNNMIIGIWLNNDNLIASQWLNSFIIIGIVVSVLGHLMVKISTSLGFVSKTSKIISIQNLIMLPCLYFSTKYYGFIGLIGTPIVLISVFSICIPGLLILKLFTISWYSTMIWFWNNLKTAIPVLAIFYYFKFYLLDSSTRTTQTTIFELVLSAVFFVVTFIITFRFYKEKVRAIKTLLSE